MFDFRAKVQIAAPKGGPRVIALLKPITRQRCRNPQELSNCATYGEDQVFHQLWPIQHHLLSRPLTIRFLQLESLWANIIENSWNFCRNLRNASIELSFHALYGTPWRPHKRVT